MVEKKYVCPTCKESFMTAEALLVHMKFAHPADGAFCEHSR